MAKSARTPYGIRLAEPHAGAVTSTGGVPTVAGYDDERRQGAITSYLQTHPEYVCVSCLAQFIDVPANQISMLRHQLMGLKVELGLCSRCRSMQIVMKPA